MPTRLTVLSPRQRARWGADAAVTLTTTGEPLHAADSKGWAQTWGSPAGGKVWIHRETNVVSR
eukprot:8428810-Pyramimonas_sp.AAC.1